MLVGDGWSTVWLLLLIGGVHWLTAREVLAEASNNWPTTEGVLVGLRHRRSRVRPTGRQIQFPNKSECTRPDKPSMSVLMPGGSLVRKLLLESGFPVVVLALAGLLLLLIFGHFLGERGVFRRFCDLPIAEVRGIVFNN